jgi:hypothetical protein
MADKDSDQPVEQPQPVPPWWADIGRRGALGLVVIAGAVAAWIFFAPVVGLPSLPFVPDEPVNGYYQAAKIAAIGLVILGTSLYYGRSRTADAEAPEAGPKQAQGQRPAKEHEG